MIIAVLLFLFFVVPHTRCGYMRLSAAAFCHHHRLFHKRTLLFHDIRIDDNGIMMLDLFNATIVGRGAK